MAAYYRDRSMKYAHAARYPWYHSCPIHPRKNKSLGTSQSDCASSLRFGTLVAYLPALCCHSYCGPDRCAKPSSSPS
jgi:hypothetical protein